MRSRPQAPACRQRTSMAYSGPTARRPHPWFLLPVLAASSMSCSHKMTLGAPSARALCSLTSCRTTTTVRTTVIITAGGAGGDEQYGSIRRHNIKKKSYMKSQVQQFYFVRSFLQCNCDISILKLRSQHPYASITVLIYHRYTDEWGLYLSSLFPSFAALNVIVLFRHRTRLPIFQFQDKKSSP